jgi:hypothetical protein
MFGSEFEPPSCIQGRRGPGVQRIAVVQLMCIVKSGAAGKHTCMDALRRPLYTSDAEDFFTIFEIFGALRLNALWCDVFSFCFVCGPYRMCLMR